MIPPYEISAGFKSWFQTIIYRPEDGRRTEAYGVLFGPKMSVFLPDEFWVSGMFLFGELDYYKPNDLAKWDSREAEIVFGRTFRFVDIGAGFRYSLFDFRQTVPGGIRQEVKIYGPMVYAGFGFPLSKSPQQHDFLGFPIGSYCGASWMFEDLSDEVRGGEHWNVEAGFYLMFNQINIEIGYRYKDHPDQVSGLHFRGMVVSLMYRF